MNSNNKLRFSLSIKKHNDLHVKVLLFYKNIATSSFSSYLRQLDYRQHLFSLLTLITTYLIIKNNYITFMQDPLCPKCKKFFGNAKNLNMCSVCYKEHLKTQTIITQASQFKVPQIPEPKQSDHSKCFACKKKVGLLGYRCKGCDCSYCNIHRLPQDHKCEGNFIQPAKDAIKKNNPNITAPKIEKI